MHPMVTRSLVELADDLVELLEGEGLVGGGVVVDGCAVHHLADVVVVEVLVQLLGDGLELLEVDHPVLVLVEEREHPPDAVLGLGLAHARADDVEELGEGDGLVLVAESVDEGEDEGVPFVESQLIEHLIDLRGIDGAASVLVEDVEGLLEILVVLGQQAVFPGRLLRLLGGLGWLGLRSSAHLIQIIIQFKFKSNQAHQLQIPLPLRSSCQERAFLPWPFRILYLDVLTSKQAQNTPFTFPSPRAFSPTTLETTETHQQSFEIKLQPALQFWFLGTLFPLCIKFYFPIDNLITKKFAYFFSPQYQTVNADSSWFGKALRRTLRCSEHSSIILQLFGRPKFSLKFPILQLGQQRFNRTMLDLSKTATIPRELSSKTLLLQGHPHLRASIRQYFLETYAVYEKLFELLGDERAFYIRAQPLRHPLIFYFGHTSTVYVNKLIDHGVIKQRVNEHYEKMFAVGVDEMDWDDLNESHYDWPSVPQTRLFRQQVKQMVLDVIDAQSEDTLSSWHSNLWVILLGIEHERIHLETSAVIIRQVPLNFIREVPEFAQCQLRQTQLKNAPANSMVEVAAWKGVWERRREDPKTYGWDNQFGLKQFDVKPFKAAQMLASNAEFLEFVLDGGYSQPQWWTDEGKRWLASKKPAMPLFWRREGEQFRLRTISSEIEMPWDWPAEVSNLQARAFCNWKSAKLGAYLRLPTEDEYYAIRSVLKQDQPDWEYQSVGNINMEFWMSPNPVNLFRTGDFFDVVGNVWQHTITPIYPFRGFEIHPVYEDFTTPTFDERHDIIKGGSFISTGNEALYHSRYAFRRHFYQFAGFRYIQTDQQMEVDLHSAEVITDLNVETHLRHHYLNASSYVLELAHLLRDRIGSKNENTRVLTVGCSVGRIPLELGKTFRESIGVDYTTRYFQMSTRLREKKFLKFKDIDIRLEDLHIDADRVELYQMNPENPDEKKINNCDWILIDGFSVKKGSLRAVLGKVVKLAKRNASIAVLSVSGFNSLTSEEGREVLAKAVAGEVQVGEEVVLKASFEDQSYLPECSGQLQFRLNQYSIVEP